MKKFFFRLEPVLKNRSDQEERAVVAQSIAQKEYLRQLGKLESLRVSLQNAGESDVSPSSARDLISVFLYIDYLTAAVAKQEKIVGQALKELDSKRQTLIQARKDKLVLQKLKDKRYQIYSEELNKWEAKVNDEQCMVLAYQRKG